MPSFKMPQLGGSGGVRGLLEGCKKLAEDSGLFGKKKGPSFPDGLRHIQIRDEAQGLLYCVSSRASL